jgi:hypothetical protein
MKDTGGPISNTASSQMTSDYENHYSVRLNKCFLLERSTLFSHGKTRSAQTLVDVNENKVYGTFDTLANGAAACAFQGSICHSEQEWQALIRPYMQD